MVQVFAFEPDLRAAEMLGQAFGVVNGAGAAHIVFQIALKICPKLRVLLGGGVGLGEFLQRGNQRFGNVHAAVFAEKALFVGGLVVLHDGFPLGR